MKKLMVAAVLMGSLAVGVTGCSWPTEQASVVDNRPTISFKTTTSADTLTVVVDGVVVGKVSQYQAPKAGLRVLPGTHLVTIQRADGTKSTQRVYVSDGVTKTLIVQ